MPGSSQCESRNRDRHTQATGDSGHACTISPSRGGPEAASEPRSPGVNVGRGTAGEDGLIPYLLATASHGIGTVLAEHLTGPKTNEVPEFAPLLREIDEYRPLARQVITADVGHTVRAHARVICEELLAHYVFTVKGGTKRPWEEGPRAARDRGKATGGASAAPSRS